MNNAPSALAYLVSRYPAVSHTFILREVQGLRRLGFRIETASINPPDRPLAKMTPDEQLEAKQTYSIKLDGAYGAACALLWAMVNRPVALLRCARAAMAFGQGLKRIYALAYAIEAVMVARWMQKHDLLHLHVHFGNEGATVGTLVKDFTGAGLSLTIHGPDEFDNIPGQRLRHKINAADRIVCISQFGRSQLMRISDPALWPKLQLCHLGVEGATYAHARNKRNEAPSIAAPFRLLCIGRLTPAKGQLLLLQACAELHHRGVPLCLTLVGDGPDRVRLENTSKSLGIGALVDFAGALNQAEVANELVKAEAFILPSLAEGIPVVLMEAMASGLPCISSPVNGIPELIEHNESGLLVAAGDVRELAKQLERLIGDSALCERIGRTGREKVMRHFEFSKNLQKLAKIFYHLPTLNRLDMNPRTARLPPIATIK